jgi:hypothetical protein
VTRCTQHCRQTLSELSSVSKVTAWVWHYLIMCLAADGSVACGGARGGGGMWLCVRLSTGDPWGWKVRQGCDEVHPALQADLK